mmetsp:Transcript_14195/g.40821  ORF Transcript_14195/g.40821 Transcript_14195/m.40821 type:complete len:218 (+) Transcript_14195:834-1487(+)
MPALPPSRVETYRLGAAYRLPLSVRASPDFPNTLTSLVPCLMQMARSWTEMHEHAACRDASFSDNLTSTQNRSTSRSCVFPPPLPAPSSCCALVEAKCQDGGIGRASGELRSDVATVKATEGKMTAPQEQSGLEHAQWLMQEVPDLNGSLLSRKGSILHSRTMPLYFSSSEVPDEVKWGNETAMASLILGEPVAVTRKCASWSLDGRDWPHAKWWHM